ncbi:MAG: hypothetical protein LBC46_06650, partial [Treponema sp.]|nr:hypothetical protein [Treponema sp.]
DTAVSGTSGRHSGASCGSLVPVGVASQVPEAVSLAPVCAVSLAQVGVASLAPDAAVSGPVGAASSGARRGSLAPVGGSLALVSTTLQHQTWRSLAPVSAASLARDAGLWHQWEAFQHQLRVSGASGRGISANIRGTRFSFEANDISFGTNESSSEANDFSFGANESSFGADDFSFEANDFSFGANESSFMANDFSFEANETSFGANHIGFETEQTGAGA